MRDKTLRPLILFTLLLLVFTYWRGRQLPTPDVLLPMSLEEPVQTEIHEAPFKVSSGGVEYTIEPLYQYELTGLVVSQHVADSVWDYLHREWQDHLNIADLCVVWGNNVRSDIYRRMHYSSGQFTCNYRTGSDADFSEFDNAALSNNHLLTPDKSLAKLISSAQIGDQIRLRGRLAIYTHNEGRGFRRGTSTVRTDTGNGACETIFIDAFEIIKSSGKKWRIGTRVLGVLLLALMIFWFVRPLRFDD